MKNAFMRFRAGVVGVAMICVTVSGAYATTSTNAATEYLDPEGDYSRLTEPEALKMAYQVLADANHDYNGHRKGAMIEIARAAKVVGLELAADGGPREDQDVSDARFHLAKRLLEQVRARLSAGAPEAERVHIDEALKEISKGLQIRAVEAE